MSQEHHEERAPDVPEERKKTTKKSPSRKEENLSLQRYFEWILNGEDEKCLPQDLHVEPW